MAYMTVVDVEQFTGMSHTDFKSAGAVMTRPEWLSFVESYITTIEQMIHRHCNVTSFDPTTVITEYHSGRGANDDEMGGYSPRYFTYGIDTQGTTYLTSDRTFYLREVFYSLTSVKEDVNPKTSVPSWVSRTERSALVAGDFAVSTKNEVTTVIFHTNIPMYGENNVEIVYKCGYGTSTPQYREIKLCALRMMSNFLLLKKKTQEVTTIRAQGIRDFSQMFDMMNESAILTESIKLILDKYKRFPIEGSWFD